MKVTLMDSRLYNAAMSGNVTDLIQLMVDENRSEILNQVTPQRNTALHIAAKRGHIDFVKELLPRKPFMLFCLNSKRENALHAAAASGKSEVVKVLLESEIDAACLCALCVQSGLTTELDSEKNLLDRLCVWRAQKKNLLDRLYFWGAPKNFWRAQNMDKDTALHIAAKEGHRDIVDLLLIKDKGLASLVNAEGKAPLFIAAEYGHVEILRRLSEAYPAPCDTDYRGRTALHAALRRGHSGVAKELLEKRAELAERADESGSTPLHLATAGGHLEIVTLILQNHPKACGAANGDGTYAIHIASQAGDEKIVRELLRWNPDSLELLDGKGKTALQVAIESDHRDVARYLSENSEYFSINEPGKEVGGHAGQPSEIVERSDRGQQANNRRETMAIVAVLLATVTFMAAFTPPGGLNEDGIPVLLDDPLFKAFVICDCFALCLSMCTITIILESLHSGYHASSTVFEWDYVFLQCAFIMTMTAFVMAIHLLTLAQTTLMRWTNRILSVGTEVCYVVFSHRPFVEACRLLTEKFRPCGGRVRKIGRFRCSFVKP